MRDLEIRDGKDVPVAALLELFAATDWAAGRTAADVSKSLERTTVLLTGWSEGRCVAMVRVLTDGVFRALVDDLVVHPGGRGRGWGRLLTDAALSHPLVRDVEEVALFTSIPAFYEKWGFRGNSQAMKRLKQIRAFPADSRLGYGHGEPAGRADGARGHRDHP